MNKFIRIWTSLAVISLLCTAPLYGQDVLINEYMSANDSNLQDRDGDYPDWIELYNPNNQILNLFNYSISDDVEKARKWIFPEVLIPPGGYLVIFASGKDRQSPLELHTNFKISSRGEELILTDEGGAVIHICDSVDLKGDEALARIPDGGDTWVRTSLPTPGSSNKAENLLFFSLDQGFYNSALPLEITSLFGDSVYYTLDGSLPDANSTLVSGAIRLDFTDSRPNIYSEIPTSPKQSDIDYKAWESPGGPVDKVHVIRCAAFRNKIRTSQVYSRTYFVEKNIGNKYSMPIISLLTDSVNLFSAEGGIYLPGKKFDSDHSNWTGNYFQKGLGWERPIHLEYFSENGKLELSQDAGVRIHGGLTRHAAQKTLRVYARDEYGEDEFYFRLLPQKEVAKYKRFLLRATMGSWQGETVIADVLAHDLVRDLDVEIMDYQPVIVYLNGEYWGIHTLRDRVDERFIEYTFGIDRDSVDMINANISLIDAGSNEHYLRLAEFIDLYDLSDQNNYEFVKTQMDISSFVDYVIAEMFFSNSDWPGNNQKFWRPQTPDGKWRWIFTDLDGAYDPEAPNIFKHAMANDGEMDWQREPVSSFLLRNLLKNSQFTSLFIARFAEILNEEFTHEKIFHKINGIKTLYEEEMPRHISRWKYPASLSTWENDTEDYLLDFLIARPCEVARQVINYFKLEEFGFNCESHEELEKHIIVAPNPNDGSFFIWNNSERSMLAHMVISDVSGRIVYVEENVLLESQIRKPYEFPEFSAGLYYLSLVSAQQSVVKPVVIY